MVIKNSVGGVTKILLEELVFEELKAKRQKKKSTCVLHTYGMRKFPHAGSSKRKIMGKIMARKKPIEIAVLDSQQYNFFCYLIGNKQKSIIKNQKIANNSFDVI